MKNAIISLSLIFAMLVPNFAVAEDTQISIAMYVDSGTAIVNDTIKYIDEDNHSVVPIVENSRTLVPVRFIADALGMEVVWDEGESRVILQGDNNKIEFVLGSNNMLVNGESRQIDSDEKIIAKTVNDRTLLPVRALCEALQKEVFYDRGLIIISDDEEIFKPENDKTKLDELISKLNVLPTVGSEENLKKLMENSNDRNGGMVYTTLKGMAVTDSVSGGGATAEMAAPAPAPSADGDYSKTNAQVEGVDEADVVITDGNYLYQVVENKIVISRINPAESLSVTKIIKRENEVFNPIEMFVDNDKLIVMATVDKTDYTPKTNDSADGVSTQKMAIMPYYYNMVVECSVYNIADKSNPVLERTFDIEGNYVSSRKINNIVYMVTNKYMNYGGVVRPLAYTDSVGGEVAVDYNSIRYFPDFQERSYLTVSSIDINMPNQKAVVETMLGGGQNIYVSKENLYVATQKYNYDDNTAKTLVYKFSLNNGSITYLKKAEVDGNIINQFSMDEYAGNFRIATTVYKEQEYNNLYILDDTMTKRGSIENIAPNEKIYSTRFVGNRGYMVTFKQVDPLFVLDLADIDNPKILGKLKIPGYSNYIHPVDDNHIIGFGKDTFITKNQYTKEDIALYDGMKMALFDITDVENPKEKFVEIIGNRGTESELLDNHKALLYSAEKNLLAFPVTVRTVKEENQNTFAYGEMEFSGAYVYNFNVENGFSLKGKITHLTKDDVLKMGDYADYGKTINRILYAGENLITTSPQKIQLHSIKDAVFVNGIEIDK